MGIPKFYRWISERYPCLAESIKDYQLPEFDNLYLDMNGIFHNCSHPDDGVHFRITEENIYKNIFHYIELLFRKIKPRKVFFMAVDGVAPRAKLNQQRGRRFRTAKEAEDTIKKAKDSGEKLPEDDPFDSNCITPGTDFMTKLDEQLKYFISKKISTDTLWQNCNVIYSGHKTPGEGEHKIMDYIRYCRSEEGYDPNTRHCLYGQDADLIMLGLTTHEPNFSLLREEIIYGKKVSKISTPEETNFYLFHISLLRDYLNIEFTSLHKLHFGYNIESIIDDVVLLAFLVGNDFIPNLPQLHINKDGLSLLFSTYKRCIPKLDGYINERGQLNLKRFQAFMENLSEVEIDQFRDINDDLKYMESKKKNNKDLKEFEFYDDDFGDIFVCSELESVPDNHIRDTFKKLGIDPPEDFGADDPSIPEEEQIFQSEFRQYKHNYYRTKFHFESVSNDELRDLAIHYVRGIQWILNYYYNGICSWSWFYPFHYSPYISDVNNFSDITLYFDMATPFLPYEQLMAVLPPYSISLVPEIYRPLMLDQNSPIKDFYPKEFQTDLNGKVQEWEAVVLIPFIEETRLIDAMKLCNKGLLEQEKNRNQHGPQFLYRFSSSSLGIYKAPSYFPPVSPNFATVEEIRKDKWLLKPSEVFKGLHLKVDLNVHFSGFPTLRHLEYSFRIAKEDVKVFQQNSRNESVIIEITPPQQVPDVADIASKVLEKSIYVNWPHLQEAKVIAVSDGSFKYQLIDNNLTAIDMDKNDKEFWNTEKKDLSSKLLRRWGIDAEQTHLLVHCKCLCGLRYSCSREGKVTLDKQWSNDISTYPLQVTVSDIAAFTPSYKMYNNITELFPVDSKVFMLGNPHYGSMGKVIQTMPESGRVRVEITYHEELVLHDAMENFQNIQNTYLFATEAGSRIQMSAALFSRITGTIFVCPSARLQPFQDQQKFVNKTNIGLNLKSNTKGEEVIGYTKKINNNWRYSELAIQAIEDYYNAYPEVVELINNTNYNATIYEDELFGNDSQEKMKELKKYLADAPFAKAQRKKCTSVILDMQSLALAQAKIKVYCQITAKKAIMQIRPHLLFQPTSLQGSSSADNKTIYEILDRIINVTDGYCVPLGARGTIIGIHPGSREMDTLYDVMFDEEFPGGSALLGITTAARCCRVYCSGMINLHNRKASQETINRSESIFSRAADTRSASSSRNYANRNPQVNASTDESWRKNSPAFQLTPSNGYSNTYNKDSTADVNSLRNKDWRDKAEIKPYERKGPNERSHYDRYNWKAGNDKLYERKGAVDTNRNERYKWRADDQKNMADISNSDVIKWSTADMSSNHKNHRKGLPPKEDFLSHQINNWRNQPAPLQNYDDTNDPKMTTEKSSDPITAPDPISLPPPQFALRSIMTVLGDPKKSNDPLKKGQGKPIDVSGMKFLIHGTHYSNWQRIKQFGLENSGDFIPCVTYVPNYFQILVYLNIEKLISDGFRFVENINNEILCSIDRKGRIPMYYIEKAFDARNDVLIYSSPSCRNPNDNLPDLNRLTKCKGRGQGLKELRERLQENDPMALSRRIKEGLENLPSLSKTRLQFPKKTSYDSSLSENSVNSIDQPQDPDEEKSQGVLKVEKMNFLPVAAHEEVKSAPVKRYANADESTHNFPVETQIANVKGRGQGLKELRDRQEENDPISLHRRIRKGLENLPSLSKTIIDFPQRQGTNSLSNENLLNPTDQFQDYEDERNVNVPDFGEVNFPHLSSQTDCVPTKVAKLRVKSSPKKQAEDVGNLPEQKIDLKDLNVPTQLIDLESIKCAENQDGKLLNPVEHFPMELYSREIILPTKMINLEPENVINTTIKSTIVNEVSKNIDKLQMPMDIKITANESGVFECREYVPEIDSEHPNLPSEKPDSKSMNDISFKSSPDTPSSQRVTPSLENHILTSIFVPTQVIRKKVAPSKLETAVSRIPPFSPESGVCFSSKTEVTAENRKKDKIVLPKTKKSRVVANFGGEDN